MDERNDELKKDWNKRQKNFGITKRAVLFKRFPGWLNEFIHRRHIFFIRNNLPAYIKDILDVGCGYGRISREIKKQYPNVKFQGVDVCTEFAAAFERDVGPCFNGVIQEYDTDQKFDTIIIVTTLMYVNSCDYETVLKHLWSMLKPGGVIICIEPASEFFSLWKRLTGKSSASPTGGKINHYTKEGLVSLFVDLNNMNIQSIASIPLIPFIALTSLHHGVVIKKGSKQGNRA